MACRKEVTTSSGTFILYDEVVGRAEAERICKSEGTILAPITNEADKNALYKLTGPEECQINYVAMYWLGLEITPSCKNKMKYFANGERWNDELHSHLYSDETLPNTALAAAQFVPVFGEKALRIVSATNENYCGEYHTKFICLRPKNKPTRARGLVKRENGSVGALPNAAYLLNVVLVVYIVVMMRYYRKKLANKE